jgi:uncharacterized protein YecE (DUF72 family)
MATDIFARGDGMLPPADQDRRIRLRDSILCRGSPTDKAGCGNVNWGWRMKIHVGTSGFSYKEWIGVFYPPKLPQRDMLRYYGERFSTVEINNSTYRMPRASVLESWAGQVPPGFRFVLKAPQTITHFRRLKNVESATKDFLAAASVLKKQRGPLLFQLPPNFKKDVPRLKEFLKLLGPKTPAAFEFRHETWFDDEVYSCLHSKSRALCLVDSDELPITELVSTANWGYLRLRRKSYTTQRLATLIAKIKMQPWKEAYVFFKHEDSGTGPKLANRFLKLAGGSNP